MYNVSVRIISIFCILLRLMKQFYCMAVVFCKPLDKQNTTNELKLFKFYKVQQKITKKLYVKRKMAAVQFKIISNIRLCFYCKISSELQNCPQHSMCLYCTPRISALLFKLF